MYIPKHFEIQDTETMTQFIQKYSFATLVSQGNDTPYATQLPLLIEQRGEGRYVLLGHFAKANPHWRNLDGTSVLAIFHGPHAYISPSWYIVEHDVPTWNYVAVHVKGNCRIINDSHALTSLLEKTVRFYDPTLPMLNHLSEEFYQKMLPGIVGFEIEVSAMEGKAKLSQNKSQDTIHNVVVELRKSGDPMNIELAKAMEKFSLAPSQE